MSQFSGRRYINVESYKKDGTPKLTPVQSIERDGTVYFRTGPDTWKVKRIRNNPHIRIVLSDMRGNPLGEWVEGEAEVLDGTDKIKAEQFFKEEYGPVGNSLINLVGRMRGHRLTAFVSVRPRQQKG
jgi:hypothetical protein